MNSLLLLQLIKVELKRTICSHLLSLNLNNSKPFKESQSKGVLFMLQEIVIINEVLEEISQICSRLTIATIKMTQNNRLETFKER